jgi:hypothetical protein
MRLGRWLSGIGLGTLAVAGLFVAPAIQAQENKSARAPQRQVTDMARGIGTFTPAAADPKLAAVLARSGLPQSGFRFTPSESRRGGSPALTLAMRARPTRAIATTTTNAQVSPVPVSLAPIAYNLGGTATGWKRFTVSNEVIRVDLASPQSLGRDHVDFNLGAVSTAKRSNRIQSGAEARALPGVTAVSVPALIADKPAAVDVGGSYSLTRHIDLTAGVRYKADRDRLPRLTDDRRESQAVYVGPAFRF